MPENPYNPYRVAYTAEEIRKFGLTENDIIAGFKGIPFWPPRTEEQQAEFEFRTDALILAALVKDVMLIEDPELTYLDVIKTFRERGFPENLIRATILRVWPIDEPVSGASS